MIKKKTPVEIASFIFVIGLSISLRIVNLATVPGWFKDEGNFINVTHNLLLGKWQHFAINGSPLIVGRPPLFFMALVPFFRFFGSDILVLRAFTAAGAILAVAFVYFTARQILGLGPAFFAGLFLAIWPESVFYNRLGLTYNWLAPLFIIFIFVTWKYLAHLSIRWLIIASIIAGISFGLEFLGLILIVALGFIVLFHEPRKLWVVGLFFVLPLIITWLPLVLSAPADTFYDLRFLFTTRANTGHFYTQFYVLMINFSNMISREVWIVLGFIGLFVLPDGRLKQLIWGLLVLFLIVFGPSRLLGALYLLPIMPLIALSIGNLIFKAIPSVITGIKNVIQTWSVSFRESTGFFPFKGFAGSLLATISVVFLLFLPLVWMLETDVDMIVNKNLIVDGDPISSPYSNLYEPAQDGEALLKFLASKIGSADVVNAPPNIAWELPGHQAGLDDLLIYEGMESFFYPPFDRNRFAFDSSLNNTKYVVSNGVWEQYTSFEGFQIIRGKINKWPIVFNEGDIQVFCNPNICN